MWQTSGRCSRSSVQDVRYMHPSLRSKSFPVRSSRKLGREQKRRMREKGERREGKVSSFPLSLPLPNVFLLSLHLSRNNSIENAGYVHPRKSPVAQWGRVWSSNQNSGGSRGGAWGACPSPIFRPNKKKILIPAPPLISGSGWPGTPPPPLSEGLGPPLQKVMGSIPFESGLF